VFEAGRFYLDGKSKRLSGSNFHERGKSNNMLFASKGAVK